MPCAGAVDAGRLLEITRRGAGRVLVSGCDPGHCRYGDGAALGARQVAAARTLLELLGVEENRITDDWSGDPDHDAIAPRLPRIMAAAWTEPDEAAGPREGD